MAEQFPHEGSVSAIAVEVIVIEISLCVAVAVLAACTAALVRGVRTFEEECREDRRALWTAIVSICNQACSDHTCPARVPVDLVLPPNLAARAKSFDSK